LSGRGESRGGGEEGGNDDELHDGCLDIRSI
jgi:hypothetical protein